MNNKKTDVTALGELLVDFTLNNTIESDIDSYAANPGGAPCNVLAMLAKLGKSSCFIGKVGDDMFGRMLEKKAKAVGIDVSGLVISKDYQTTLAFVKSLENGDRDFAFYRKNGADAYLTEEELNENLIRESKIFHFGSLSMTNNLCESATKRAVECAKESGCIISFDPNYRKDLWESEEYAKEKIEWGLKVCDVLKIADNEISLITGEDNYEKGGRIIKDKYNIPLVFATLGKKGSIAFFEDESIFVPGFANEKTIDCTGAGDTFCACALGKLMDLSDDKWDKSFVFERINNVVLKNILIFANAAASIITTRKGAMCVMPDINEVEEVLKIADK